MYLFVFEGVTLQYSGRKPIRSVAIDYVSDDKIVRELIGGKKKSMLPMIILILNSRSVIISNLIVCFSKGVE